jgi:hypothetical protein
VTSSQVSHHEAGVEYIEYKVREVSLYSGNNYNKIIPYYLYYSFTLIVPKGSVTQLYINFNPTILFWNNIVTIFTTAKRGLSPFIFFLYIRLLPDDG